MKKREKWTDLPD